MNAVIEVLYLRRPRLEYISPPVCEFDFSSSGGPVIVLDALGRIPAPSGFVLGGRGRFTLSWNNYPGALCYTVYKAVDSNNPFGEYVVVAECIEDPMIDLEPEGEGCYRVSAITENGESELSDPICEVGSCPFILSGSTPSVVTINEGDTISLSCEVSNPGAVQFFHWYKDGVFLEDTTGGTEAEYEKLNAQPSDSGSYTLRIAGNGCEDESDPSVVTVNAGPPCTPDIQIVSFPTAFDLGSDGTLIGVSDFNRPFYHRNGVSQDIRTEVDSSPVTASQAATTVTASANFFSASDVNKIIVFSTSQEAKITAFVSPLQVTVTPSQIVPSTTFVLRGNTLGGTLGQGYVANGNGILGGIEELFGTAVFHGFWFNLNTNEIRDLGAIYTPIALAEDGFMLLMDTTGSGAAVLYDPDAQTFTVLPDLGFGSTPRIMNDAHQAGVACGVPAAGSHACRIDAGVLTDIHPVEAGTQASEPNDINAAGFIVGFYTDPVTFDTRTFVNSGGASTDIGNIAGNIEGLAVNNSNIVVGYVDTSPTITQAFFWTSGGGIQIIPQLGGTTEGEASAINSDGWIVGDMNNVAFLYRDGVTHDLMDLIPGGTLWTNLFSADFITDDGVISGLGINDGNFSRYWLQLC